MMYAVTLVIAIAFTAWMMYKGAHWWDDDEPFPPVDGLE